MNENIDLTKILKDCPIGWKFYSSVYGDVEFVKIYREPVLCNPSPQEDEWFGQETYNSKHPIVFLADGFEYRASSGGEIIKGCGECTFFPSREQRDWSKFTAPWYKNEKFDPKTLKAFDRVLVRDASSCYWKCNFFSGIDDSTSNDKFITISFAYRFCIPYNDDTKHLVGTSNEAPEYYRYWEE